MIDYKKISEIYGSKDVIKPLLLGKKEHKEAFYEGYEFGYENGFKDAKRLLDDLLYNELEFEDSLVSLLKHHTSWKGHSNQDHKPAPQNL